MAVGKILRFHDVRGYGFIAPAGGGEDVFVHASDFGEQRHLVRAGLPVEFEVAESDRGLKVTTVHLLDTDPPPGPERPATGVTGRDDDGMCDVLRPREFTAEITDLLIRQVPSLTGAQIAQIRQHLTDFARAHGWVEA